MVVDETHVECAVARSTPGYERALGLDSPAIERTPVSTTVLYMSMSLDGFIAGPNETPDNGLGDGGQRLHDWLIAESGLEGGCGDEHLRRAIHGSVSGVNRQVVDEFMATGAVVAGRGTVEPAGYWDGDHHDGVPIFIVSRSEPPAEVAKMPLVTFVDDVSTAMGEAKRAAGDKDVLVHGAGVTQLALAAGVLDAIEISVVPVLLGQGRRLFDNLGPEHVELERARILEGEAGLTHMHYRVRRA
jgi:dihydrofolate reductase